MKQIRRKVFETNSSSTHSITIAKKTEIKEKNIPRNSKSIYLVKEFGDVDGGECEYDLNAHMDEEDKLRYIVNMIATVYDSCHDYDETKENFILLINQDLFIWLKEVVEEETGSRIEFDIQENRYFPYFETTYAEDDNIEELLHIEEDGESFNKEKFKKRVKEIIFNKDIAIYNENCPYGMEEASIKRKLGGM